MRLFYRSEELIHFQDVQFNPFILVDSPSLVSGCKQPCAIREFEGEGELRYQLLFENWNEAVSAHEHIQRQSKKDSNSRHPGFLWISDLSQQYMLATGTTLFKGMDFSELHVLALDIETDCSQGYGFSNADRIGDRILSIAIADSHGEELLIAGDELNEAAMIDALNEAICQRDPDVIVGHNIFRFDLDYLAKRARINGVKLKWGRNGSELHLSGNSRWQLAEKTIEYPRFDIYGRHIIDTYFLSLIFDVSERALPGHGLKALARYFGIASKNRTYIHGDAISSTFRENSSVLYAYNLDDSRETLALYRQLAYPWFLQSTIFPYSFQNCPLRGNATRINSLLIREYLYQGHSIPQVDSVPVISFEGGYTELVMQGVFSPVVHCDVASLYPSLMLTYRIGSRKDSLSIFLPLLAELKRFRLEAKKMAKSVIEIDELRYWQSLQQVFKLLINSFFGYLGSSIHNFSDPESAAEITRLGRVTINQMISELKKLKAEPLEIDTDGIYFKPPKGCETEEDERALVRSVSATLPQGIELEHDGRYGAMCAYKAKNYALLHYDGNITIKGSGLKSRGMEPYLRQFMAEMLKLILNGEAQKVEQLYADYCRKINNRDVEIEWLARTESINESPQSYLEKVRNGARNRSAAFEIALKSDRSYHAGDQISYYVCGSGGDVTVYDHCSPAENFNKSHPDINREYYRQKLRNLKDRFAVFLPQEPTLF